VWVGVTPSPCAAMNSVQGVTDNNKLALEAPDVRIGNPEKRRLYRCCLKSLENIAEQ
jgi:hypothetical protein